MNYRLWCAMARPRLLSLAIVPLALAQCQPACTPSSPAVPPPDVECLEPSVGELGGQLPRKRGDSGETVRTIQQILIRLRFSVGPSGADGMFGAATEDAVRAWQGSPVFGELRVTGQICMEDYRAITIDSESEGG